MALLALLVGMAALAACSRSGEPGTAALSPAPVTVRAEARDDRFELVLESAQEAWRAGDPIDVRATLTYLGEEDGIDYAASGGGAIAFSVREIGGTRLMDAIRTDDCVPYTISAAEPLVVQYQKSGAIDPGEPNEAFYQSFFADPVFSLPVGRWEVTALMELYVPTCERDAETHLEAALTLVVE
jgi:hypothetical protein